MNAPTLIKALTWEIVEMRKKHEGGAHWLRLLVDHDAAPEQSERLEAYLLLRFPE